MDEKTVHEECLVVVGGSFDRAGEVSSAIKTILKQMGFSSDVVRRAALVAYESEINIVSYAFRGIISLRVLPGSIMIEAADEGPGIPDIELAMKPGYSTASAKIREMGFGAGMGLCNIKNFCDIFRISSEVGQGTYLQMIINTDNDSFAG